MVLRVMGTAEQSSQGRPAIRSGQSLLAAAGEAHDQTDAGLMSRRGTKGQASALADPQEIFPSWLSAYRGAARVGRRDMVRRALAPRVGSKGRAIGKTLRMC